MFYWKPPGACPATCRVTGREMSTEPMPRVTTATVHAQQKISSPSGGASDEWESVAPKKTSCENHYGNTGTQQAERGSVCTETPLSAKSTRPFKRCSVPWWATMKLHLVKGEISCAQAGKHQWASMNEPGHPRAWDQISCGSEVWGAALSPKGMQNYQTKKKKLYVFVSDQETKPAWGERRGHQKACGYHFQTATKLKQTSMPQELQQPGATQQQLLLKALTLKQNIFLLEAENPAHGGCSGWDGKKQWEECVSLLQPQGLQDRQKSPWKITSSWEIHSAQLLFFPIPVSPASFKARFCGFHKFQAG